MDRNEINEHPSGYLIMDTCCFLNYIEGKRSDAFEYQEIKEFIEKNKLWLVMWVLGHQKLMLKKEASLGRKYIALWSRE